MGVDVAVYVGVGIGFGVGVAVGVGVPVGVVVGVSADKPFWPEMIREPCEVRSIRTGPEACAAMDRESIMIQTMTQEFCDMGIAAFHDRYPGPIHNIQGGGVKQKQTDSGRWGKFEV